MAKLYLIRSCLRRPPFCSRSCYILLFSTSVMISLFLYLINAREPLEFVDSFIRLESPKSVSKIEQDQQINFKVEILEETEVDKMIGIVDDGTPAPYTCRIPRIDPFDKSISEYVAHPKSAHCKKVQPDLVWVDEEGVLKLNLSEVKLFEENKNQSVTCEYKYFDRGATDSQLIYEKPKKLEESVRLKRNFVKVTCSANATKIYTNVFAYPTPIATNRHLLNGTRQPLSSDGDDMSVFIFTFESTSSSMAVRHLPKTLAYLKKTSAIIFESYLKVGENTLPNLAALFTGKRARQEQTNMPQELPQPTGGYYDEWPMIWNRYRLEKGYETIYMEDQSFIGTFHYSGKGFKIKPTDYWYYPFYESERFQSGSYGRSTKFCTLNRPNYEIFTEILRRHLEQGRNRRQFLFSIFSDLSHDYTSDIERADQTLYELFNRLDASQALNRTIVIVMGDHGARFTSVRQTPIGFAEERLPFFSIRLPNYLSRKYPRLIDTLNSNKKKLISLFDLHETLIDILNQTYNGSMMTDQSIRGRSIFRPLPSDRKCLQAGIPDRYCLCDSYDIKLIDHFLARKAAELVNIEVNKMITTHEKCEKWELEKILYFIKIPWPSEDLLKTNTYFVAFKSNPGGKFEGVVVRNLTDDSLTFKSGTLERINQFGRLGGCVSSKLWKYCVCK